MTYDDVVFAEQSTATALDVAASDTSSFHYEVVPLASFEYTAEDDMLRYPCPCGDRFEIPREAFLGGGRIAQCPTCSLTVIIQAPSDASEVVALLASIMAQ